MHDDTTLPFRFDVPKELPFAFSLTALAEHLALLVDQRKRRGVRFPLVPLLLTALLAKRAGSSRREPLSHWAQLCATKLTARFGLSRPTMPHQSTWSRLFAHALDLANFFLAQQHASELPERGSIVLARDGKTLRGTIPAGHRRGVHLLAASLPEQGIVLAQAPVDRKEHEIAGAPTLLARLPLAGVVVVGDALHAQRTICRSIVEATDDYRQRVVHRGILLAVSTRSSIRPWPRSQLLVHTATDVAQALPSSAA